MRRLATRQARDHRARCLAARHNHPAHASARPCLRDASHRMSPPARPLHRVRAFPAALQPDSAGAEAAMTIGVVPSLSLRPRDRLRCAAPLRRVWQADRGRSTGIRSARCVDLRQRRARAGAGDRGRGAGDEGRAPESRALRPAGRQRRKFAGNPIATPEPPVISACAAAASPIASRCASSTASTMA